MRNLDEYINSPLEFESDLLSLFGRQDDLIIFDIGACEGEDSIRYAKLFPNAKVYAFEPRPDNISSARKNIEKYQCTSIELTEVALSDEIGTAIFHLSSGHPEGATDTSWNRYNKSSSLLQPVVGENQKYWPRLQFNESIEVKTITLENFCSSNEIRHIDFIHMDVQGAEMKVLVGSGSFINKIKAVWMEVEDISLYQEQPLRDEVETFMKEHGFVKILEQEALAGIYGDQLYVNSLFFPDRESLKNSGNEGVLFKLFQWIKTGSINRTQMIITKICCGLGNQLFQYAVGRHLALINNTELKLDISSYENDSLRHYMLDNFNVKAGIASSSEVEKVKRPRLYGRRDILLDRFEKIGFYHRPVVIKEKENDLRFDPSVLRKTKHAYLDGWWATEKYFKEISPIIRSELTLRNPLSRESAKLLAEIESNNAISVHVRRGDKASDLTINHWHGTCSLDYYNRAVDLIAEQVSLPHFFVFSDDPEWAIDNLKFGFPTTYVEHNHDNGRDFEDLVLMSYCKNHVIANSTFSWWGAWLCDYQDKFVVAPKKWFNNLNYDEKDIIPSRWYKL